MLSLTNMKSEKLVRAFSEVSPAIENVLAEIALNESCLSEA